MGGESPASVLYSSDGTELSVISGSAVPAGTHAILISGITPSGNAAYIPASSIGSLGVSEMSNSFVVQSNATVTTSGSVLVTASYFGTQEIVLIVNSTVAPTGTTPTIMYTIQEIDPGNGITVFGNSASTSIINTGNSPGVFTAVLNITSSPMVRVSWAITGTTPSFTGVYATVVTKSTPSTQTITGSISATNPSVSITNTSPPGSATYIGGSVTTAAPAYTNNTMNALSLTTAGALRIDGSGVTQPVSGAVTSNQGAPNTLANGWPVEITDGINILGTSAHPLIISGAITTNKATTSSITTVVSATANTTLLAANANRIFASIYNGANKTAYIKLGTAASTSSFSIQLLPNSYWEVPNDWAGAINAVWANGVNGNNALITELSP
jgi:hypothetical protein